MATKHQTAPKYGLRPQECAAAVGSSALWDEIEAAGWVHPVVNRHKMKIFDAGHVAQAWARILAGENPKPKNQTHQN